MSAAPAQAAPAVFTVNAFDDLPDWNPGDGKCETAHVKTCTLRAAIMEANHTDNATIKLGAGVHTLSIPGIDEDAAAKGDLDVLKGMTIEGAGKDTVVDANTIDRAFDVFAANSPGTKYAVTMKSFVIRNGRAKGMYLADQKGGAIRNHGSLAVSDMLMHHNSDLDNAEEYLGGAILNMAEGHLAMADSTLTDNVGDGALANWGTATVLRSVIKRTNLLPSNVDLHGGGVFNSGKLTMTDSTISENRGGGITSRSQYQAGGPAADLTLERVTVSDNTEGAGVGGIEAGNSMKLVNVTISNNSAGDHSGNGPAPGGLKLSNGDMTLQNVTLTGNKGWNGGVGGMKVEFNASVQTNNAILANNVNGDCWGSILTQGVTLVEDPTNCLGVSGPGNLTNVDPKLGPLQDNGGPTKTHALLPGSKAIDAGIYVNCPSTDQRGKPRPANGDGVGDAKCDLGAFEIQ